MGKVSAASCWLYKRGHPCLFQTRCREDLFPCVWATDTVFCAAAEKQHMVTSNEDRHVAYKDVMQKIWDANRHPALDYLLVNFSEGGQVGPAKEITLRVASAGMASRGPVLCDCPATADWDVSVPAANRWRAHDMTVLRS